MIGLRTIDIEGALVDALGDNVSAAPVPANMAPPWVCVWRTGGTRRAYVQDVHNLSIDCYAKTWASAATLASDTMGAITDLEGQTIGGVPCYEVSVMTLPYNNPDPSRPDVPRVTFAVQLATRVEHE